MTTSAQSIINTCAVTLQDTPSVRWTQAELLGYLNDGQLAAVTIRPDLTATTQSFVPREGAGQNLPPEALALIDISRNTSGRRRAITKVDRVALDAVSRDWQSMPGVTEFVHFMFDPVTPREFWLYPPAKATGGSVELRYSAYPAPCAIDSLISLRDEFATPLHHYVVFRALSKDSEYAANAATATAHLQLFNAALGAQLQSTALVAPKQ